jgi:hypothetical protein
MRAGEPRVGYPGGVTLRKLAVNPLRLFGGCVLGHEQRKSMALTETIEIHGLLHVSKRERVSLSATRMPTESSPRDERP